MRKFLASIVLIGLLGCIRGQTQTPKEVLHKTLRAHALLEGARFSIRADITGYFSPLQPYLLDGHLRATGVIANGGRSLSVSGALVGSLLRVGPDAPEKIGLAGDILLLPSGDRFLRIRTFDGDERLRQLFAPLSASGHWIHTTTAGAVFGPDLTQDPARLDEIVDSIEVTQDRGIVSCGQHRCYSYALRLGTGAAIQAAPEEWKPIDPANLRGSVLIDTSLYLVREIHWTLTNDTGTSPLTGTIDFLLSNHNDRALRITPPPSADTVSP